MSYKLQNIVAFAGLNSSVAPELIKDEEAREILNFRMEKVGKLVSRNGYVYGLFGRLGSVTSIPVYNADNTFNEALLTVENTSWRQILSYIHNLGIIGIGEYVLSSFWKKFDTDRFMVYYVRGMAIGSPSQPMDPYYRRYSRGEEVIHPYHTPINQFVRSSDSNKFFSMFLLAPVTGEFKNTLIYYPYPYDFYDDPDDPNLDIGFVADYVADNLYGELVENDWRYNVDSRAVYNLSNYSYIVSPNRYIPALMDPAEEKLTIQNNWDSWITHYVCMNQYRDSLIISDKINGDMRLINQKDVFSTADNDFPHRLILAKNIQFTFDINTVYMDLRFGEGQENDKIAGVNTYMALYDYKLPEKDYILTDDNGAGEISDPNKWAPLDNASYGEAGDTQKVEKLFDQYRKRSAPPLSLFSKLWVETSSGGIYKDKPGLMNYITVNTRYLFTYTNADTPGKFIDIYGKLQLQEEEYINQDGEKTKEISANVYRWKDHTLTYFPSSGVSIKGHKQLLTERDRIFNKLHSGTSRVTKLSVKDPWGRDVPLGVWRYRFVWDLGDGVYSLPSAEMLVPDILWSAVKDDEINVIKDDVEKGYKTSSLYYERPKNLDEIEDFLKEYVVIGRMEEKYYSSLGNQSFLSMQYPYIDSSEVETSILKGPSLFFINDDPNNPNHPVLELTRVGKLFFDLKKKIYPEDHRFGGEYESLFPVELYSDILERKPYEDELRRRDLTTLITVDYGKIVKLRGYAWEGVGLIKENIDLITDEFQGMYHFENFGGYAIPIFPNPTEYKTLNSLCTSNGEFRLSYVNFVQLVLPGYNAGIDAYHNRLFGGYYGRIRCNSSLLFSGWSTSYGSIEKDIYVNFVADPNDFNNYEYGLENIEWVDDTVNGNLLYPVPEIWFGDSEPLLLRRPATLVRAVAKEYDKLNVTKQIDSTAKSRLIKDGISSIEIMGYNDEYFYESEYSFLFTNNKNSYTDNLSPYKLRERYNMMYGDIVSFVEKKNSNKSDKDIKLGKPTVVCSSFLVDGKSESIVVYDVVYDGDIVGGGKLYKIGSNPMKIRVPKPRDMYGNFNDYIDGDPSRYYVTILIPSSDISHNWSSWYFFSYDNGSKKYTELGGQISYLDPNGDYVEIDVYLDEVLFYAYEDSNVPGNSGPISINGTTMTIEDIFFIRLMSLDKGASNIRMIIYGEAQRFIGLEQLTSYFPSSLLFKAPRIGLKIKNEDVPKRAKRLLIFRTKCSHANDFIPNNYGLVDAVEVKRDKEGNAYNSEIGFNGFYYFDKVMDDALDFSNNVVSYEGITRALQSRFNVNVNERVYFGNVRIAYQPISPRSLVYDYNNSVPNVSFSFLDARRYRMEDPSAPYGMNKYTNSTLEYKFVYKDVSGVRSAPSSSITIRISDSEYEESYIGFSFIPSAYNDSIVSIEIYRRLIPYEFYYIGSVSPEDEGVFVDTLDNFDYSNLKQMPTIKPLVEDYISGVYWSEPYRSDWIKPESFVEYGSGDGDQITGLQVLYGNLIVFKENSMYRSAALGQEIPITRTDVIDPTIGLIAPNAVVNVNNTLYFLSWKGIMMYDNNVLKKIDDKVSEEIQFILANSPKEYIRDVTAGYNPTYDEIWFNFPPLRTIHPDIDEEKLGPAPGIDDNERQYDYGEAKMIRQGAAQDFVNYYYRKIYGHIYVFSPTKGYVTKFGYPPTVGDPRDYVPYENYFSLREVVDPRQLVRLYYTNSMGEMRSADIFPSYYGTNLYQDPMTDATNFLWAGIYVETPYSNLLGVPSITDEDEIINPPVVHNEYKRFWGTGLNRAWTFGILQPNRWFPGPRRITNEWDANDIFNRPDTEYSVLTPIRNIYKSKYFTGDTETMLKRIRQINFNIFSRGNINIRVKSVVIQTNDPNFADERIDDEVGDWITNIRNSVTETFNFQPSVSGIDQIARTQWTGTGSNVLSVIPRFPKLTNSSMKDDWYGKPIRFSIEIDTYLRTQINNIGIYWRPIHTYLG